MIRMYRVIGRLENVELVYSSRLYESVESAHDDFERALMLCDQAWIEEVHIVKVRNK